VLGPGLGDLFVGRVAGNVDSIHMLGSFEFAKVVKGTKLSSSWATPPAAQTAMPVKTSGGAVNDIREKSQSIADLGEEGALKVVGAMCDITSNQVRFPDI